MTDDTTTLSKFWPKIQASYPTVQPQPGLPPMTEDFTQLGGMPSLSFQFLGAPPPTRYWLLNEAATELIQVQPDRFAYNWRKDPEDTAYPRYSHLRQRFADHFSSFAETVAEEGRPAVPTWCEVTYINPIPAEAEDGSRLDLSRILTRFSGVRPPGLPAPEDSNFSERFVLKRDGAAFGRFYIGVSPGFRNEDQAPIYVVQLVARGHTATPDLAGVLAFLDEGRHLIVTTFRDITTDEMHEAWGLE